ncbi:MAG: hypothetical protein WAU68_14710 [Vitreimonas sp.]
MEAIIVIIVALISIVLLHAGYQIALCLMRWTPSLLLGLFLGWLTYRHNPQALEAIGVGALTTLVAKGVLPRVLQR